MQTKLMIWSPDETGVQMKQGGAASNSEVVRRIDLSNPRIREIRKTSPLRVAAYNVHKCRGFDGRVRPDRILGVLKEIDADIIALQEVVCAEGKTREDDQARYLADGLEAYVEFGENRRHKGGAYGNALLSRFPIHHATNYDLSVAGRERRGCLRADVCLGDGGWLHIFNLHLGTSFFERREQARKLFRQQILTDAHVPGNKIVLGDFNEWTKGLASRLLQAHFRNAASGTSVGIRTYPGFLPMLRLDHIYADHELELCSAGVHRSRTALLASDHLPLIAEFAAVDRPSGSVLEAAPADKPASFQQGCDSRRSSSA